MLNIGITGGIGSGKTTVCEIFEALGIPVYNADERAKYLMNHEHYLIDQLKKHFGDDIYADGVLDRKLLAQKVFGNKEKLELLNSLVHPVVFRDTERWLREQGARHVPYTLREAALLVETGSYKLLDKLIVVTAPADVRITRVKQRDNISEQEITARMQHQLNEADKIKLADFVIQNDGDLEHLKHQVSDIHQRLLKLSASTKK